MKKLFLILLCVVFIISTTACTSTTGSKDTVTLTGVAKGFGGNVTVNVTKQGDKIIAVDITEQNESEGIATPALEQIPAAIVKANTTEVDTVSGATVTSNAIINAVNNALDPVKYPAPEETNKGDSGPISAANVYQGFGLANNGRVGPGKDNTETPVYSINQVFANALFDGEGKILSIYVDQLEFATPNYDGDGMPHLSGFPGQGGYNNDENHDETVDGKTPDSEEYFISEVNDWITKRERGSKYVMSPVGSWSDQMDSFQELFVGKTVSEVEEWFNKYTSDINGRPLKAESTKDEDKAKYEALAIEEKEMLVDVTTGATMSLNDSHGNIIAAIKSAYDNRVPLDIKSAALQGFGLTNMPRVGPGKDNTGTPVYSVNQVFANTLFDNDGKIVAIYVDQLEFATPNYDGDGMPHFSGFPGQGGYNNDENHDEVVDGKTPDTEEYFLDEVSGWVTKRDRGDKYVMSAIGSWSDQMDAFQALFIGKTVEEVEQWFAKYTSDVNGRPLKADSTKEEDTAKYSALTSEEKEMLVDVTTGATMSLNDPHGDIIAAIRNSFDNAIKIDLTVE